MLPTAIVPLQHHFAGRIRRIQVNISEQRVADCHWQRRHRVVEEVLMLPAEQRRLVCQCPEYGAGLLLTQFQPSPSPPSRPGRHRILHPDASRGWLDYLRRR